MKSYFPTPTIEQWQRYHRSLPIIPSLFNPAMWEQLRQVLYEAKLLLRRHKKDLRQIKRHRQHRAKVKAAQGMPTQNLMRSVY